MKCRLTQHKISGYGLGLIGVAIEQDAAYWEAHIEHDVGMSQEVSFGVATRKDQQFYRGMEEQGECIEIRRRLVVCITFSHCFSFSSDSSEAKGTSLMRSIKVKNGDVIGIAVQQSDLPMVQFLLNGEPLHDLAVNRFRGAVYPAIYLPENDGLSVRFVFRESEFQKMSPHARFGPLIVARGII